MGHTFTSLAALAQPPGADAASDRRRPQSITQDKLHSPTGSDTQLQCNTREAHSPDDDHDTFTATSPRRHEDSPSPTPSGSPMVLDDTPKFEHAQPDLDRENRNPGGDGLGEPQYSKVRGLLPIYEYWSSISLTFHSHWTHRATHGDPKPLRSLKANTVNARPASRTQRFPKGYCPNPRYALVISWRELFIQPNL